MLSLTRITDALPVETPAFSVTPTDFVNVAFTPALLLPIALGATITTHPKFHPQCKSGFEGFAEELVRENEEGEEYYVDHFHTWKEVKISLIECVFTEAHELALSDSLNGEPPTLAARAGYALGWLSALGLTNRPLALQGAALLSQLVAIQQPPTQQPEALLPAYAVPFLPISQGSSSTPSYPHTHTRRVGGDGFPLDM